MKTVGIIPCRYDSQRFPGKPLADINGKPMMWHVYQCSTRSRMLDAVYVATDDYRIKDACEQLDINVILTGSNHETGTDRVAECKALIDADYYVNIQGDEPMLEANAIDTIVEAIQQCKDPMVMAANA
ncbi:MAG: NTP transferase domain-containing protein, partial [Anaerolineales bacterium]|nr:NTP transferase domain-containing protein [Anaerolineales bacterium]